MEIIAFMLIISQLSEIIPPKLIILLTHGNNRFYVKYSLNLWK